jgi:hypothetical protein
MPENEKTISNDFVISRVLNAPRDLVWQCFTDPARMKQWWGPKGVKIMKSDMDLRVGGTYHYGMQTPDGNVMLGQADLPRNHSAGAAGADQFVLGRSRRHDPAPAVADLADGNVLGLHFRGSRRRQDEVYGALVAA